MPPLPDTTEPAADNAAYSSPSPRGERAGVRCEDAPNGHDFPPGYLDRAATLIQGSHATAADPLPGPLLEAFLPEPLVAAGYTLREVVAADWAILKKLDSPILKELQGLAMNPDLPRPEIAYTEEDIWELLFLWTRPPREVRACLARGRPEFREHVLRETADALPASIVQERGAILTALASNLVRALATRVTHQPAGEDGPNFRKAPPGTASAGGSIT